MPLATTTATTSRGDVPTSVHDESHCRAVKDPEVSATIAQMLARVGEKLDSEFVSLGHSGPQHLRIVGGRKLSGSIPVKTSKNAAVALLCASLLNKGRTTLRSLARIEEVNRIIEVLTSIGVRVRWLPDSNDLEIGRASCRERV